MLPMPDWLSGTSLPLPFRQPPVLGVAGASTGPRHRRRTGTDRAGFLDHRAGVP